MFISLIIFSILFVNIFSVNADFMDEETEENKKEQQLIKKIEIIHEKFPNQIDPVALYATVSYREYFVGYVDEAYDPNFDEGAYDDAWSSFKTDYDNSKAMYNNGTGDSCGDNCLNNVDITNPARTYETTVADQTGDKPNSIDLLTAATIVMLDSSGWFGNYSDENYQKALAGNSLVGSLIYQDGDTYAQKFLASIYNGAFCAAGFIADQVTGGFAVDFALTGFDPTKLEEFEATNLFSNTTERIGRYFTMANICLNGFIGGTYSAAQNIEDEELKQGKKDEIAAEIIDYANRLRDMYGSDDCVVNPTSSGAFASWKQYDDAWGNLTLGSSGETMRSSGCLITAFAIQMARSGTQISNLPDGYSSFNPGALVTTLNDNGGFYGAAFNWSGYQSIASNWHVYSRNKAVNTGSTSTLAQILSDELSTGVDGQYQKFIVLQLHHDGSSQHWVAVDTVTNDSVTIFDPGASGTTLDDNYSGWVVETYAVMYATDVPMGQTGTSLNSDVNYCETSGNIIIPEEFGNGGYTVTVYNDFNWGYTQGDLYDEWAAAGGVFDDGIAVYQGRYLIACTLKFGNVGDKVDFFLDDGTKIPAIIADIKNENDPNANEWGHNNGQNIIEFEVSHVAFYDQYQSNPGTNGWKMEWSGKRVSSATNLGSIWV